MTTTRQTQNAQDRGELPKVPTSASLLTHASDLRRSAPTPELAARAAGLEKRAAAIVQKERPTQRSKGYYTKALARANAKATYLDRFDRAKADGATDLDAAEAAVKSRYLRWDAEKKKLQTGLNPARRLEKAEILRDRLGKRRALAQ